MNQPLLWYRIMQVARFLFVLLIVWAGYYILFYGLKLLYPFLIGLLIAYMINRPVNFLERKAKFPRWLSVLTNLIFFIGIFITILTILIAKIVIEIGRLIEMIPLYKDKLKNYFQEFIANDVVINFYEQISRFVETVNDRYREQIDQNIDQGLKAIADGGSDLVINILTTIKNIISSIPGAATVLVISVLAAFFISKDFYKLKEKVRQWVPVKIHGRTKDVLHDLRLALFGFIKAQLTLISITAAIVIVGLLILRVEYAVTIGLISGLVDLLPYLGTGTVFVPWIVYVFFTGNYSLVIGLSILYGVVILQRQLMEPKILATNVGLDPLITLIALFVGLQLLGFIGLIIGPVTIVVYNALYRTGVFKDIWTYIKGKEPVT